MSEKLASRKSVVVSEAVQRRVKARAAELGRSLKAVVEEALTAWLEGSAGARGPRVVEQMMGAHVTGAGTIEREHPSCLWCRSPMYDQSGAGPYCSDGCRQAHQATDRREGTPS